MSLRLRFTLEAQEDVHDAWFWYEQRQPGLGDAFLAELEKTNERILDRPMIFGEREFKTRKARLHRFPYFVSFLLLRDLVIVVAVCHAHRDPGFLRERADIF